MEFVTDDSKKSSLWVPSVKSSNLENKFSQTDDFYWIWLWFPSQGQSWRHEKCPCFLRLYLLSGCGPSWTVGWQWASLSHLARCGWFSVPVCGMCFCAQASSVSSCYQVFVFLQPSWPLRVLGCSHTSEPLHCFAKIFLQIKFRTWFLTVFSFDGIFRQLVLWKHIGE